MESLGLQESNLTIPTTHNRVENFDPEVIRADAQATRIIVHQDYPALVDRFLALKRGTAATSNEQKLFAHPFTWQQQVRRLIEKRPLSFLTSRDTTLFRDGTFLPDGRDFWDAIGKEGSDYSTFQDYLSYDEIMLGSLIGVSGPSYFINDGDRYNKGRQGAPGTFEPRGIIVGLVGPRFERVDQMDSNIILSGVAPGQMHPSIVGAFTECFKLEKSPDKGFDLPMYRARIRMTLETLLLEANKRANEAGQKAFVHVVGLGLGVWMCDTRQPDSYVVALGETLTALKGKLGQIGTIYVSWIKTTKQNQDILTNIALEQGIKIMFGKRRPAEKLTGDEADQLLVVSYAWDGNSFPGNEYWHGSLAASGDPAAACMSTIPELHNPMVNPEFLDRIHVHAGQ
ncbi:uncharacterized protein GGS22DRAFT_151922 [Annulohypoxylon maeteangense]|uniref:uncharacterized protein n=1 Tax=Annulohypoxylon maeteangense TaxID=1927788 RepID=UPI0020076650|nr:uncharacterized protein GGS22DRAFT_151922 [Annulohypoxylon maeteangense]KAI0888599.1 hypothetical protein GGS22DRAFT_151922 [Annulohypoxylon maeteangense]